MAGINWGLLGKLDPVGSFMEGREDRRRLDLDRARQESGRLAQSGDLEGAASVLMRAGGAAEASPLWNMLTQRQGMEHRRADRAEDVTWRQSQADRQDRQWQATHGLQRQIAEQGRLPAGFQRAPEGGLAPLPGGPADPNYLARVNEAKGTGADKPSDLRKEIRSLPSYKAAATVVPMYNTMVKAAQRDTRAADVSIVFSFMKMLDPTSVVRESEVDMANNIATLPQQYRAQVQSFLSGQGRLSPEVRRAIVAESRTAVDQYKAAFDRDIAQYRGITERSRFNQQDVIPSFEPLGDLPQSPGGGGDFEIIGVR